MASRNRGKSKPKLRDLSRIGPTDEEYDAVQDALGRDGSPITIAILGASLVEHGLETELRNCFPRSDDETWRLLTDDRGPLGTFSQKITAAYGLGIIDDVIRDALNTIRQIRNAFAHTKRLIDFNNELITRELEKATLPPEERSKLYKNLSSVRAAPHGPKSAYEMLCLIVCMELFAEGSRRLEAKKVHLKAQLRRYRSRLAEALKQASSDGLDIPALLSSIDLPEEVLDIDEI